MGKHEKKISGWLQAGSGLGLGASGKGSHRDLSSLKVIALHAFIEPGFRAHTYNVKWITSDLLRFWEV